MSTATRLLEIRRFSLVRTGAGLNAAAAVVAVMSGVEAERALGPGLHGVVLATVVLGVALARFPSDQPLPRQVLPTSAFVILAGCTFSLTVPHYQGDPSERTHVAAITNLFGEGGLTITQATTCSTIAWGALLLGWTIAIVSWGLCSVLARRQQDAGDETT